VGENLQFGLVALVGFLLGSVCTRLFSGGAAWFFRRRARRRFVQFVQPERFTSALPPLPDTKSEGVGISIHQVLRQQEQDCEEKSLLRLPHMGEKAPRCYEMTGRVFAVLDALSSCAWGCAQGDHVLERLVARSVNHSRAAWKLALMGFYDEALVLTRGVGEIANLLSLFDARSESFAHWKSLDERTRRREFSPVRVRTELETIGTPIRVVSETYAELSSRNVHVNPSTSPQTYDMLGRPKGGGYFQEAGLLICQNELAESLTFVTYTKPR